MGARDVVRTGTSVVLAAWGLLLVARPAGTMRAVTGGAPVPPDPVARVLGGRELLQHALLVRTSSRRLALAGAAVDALHATSMLAAARIWPQYRRAALTSAGVAGGSAVLTVATAPPS